jgi:hypothetical protein
MSLQSHLSVAVKKSTITNICKSLSVFSFIVEFINICSVILALSANKFPIDSSPLFSRSEVEEVKLVKRAARPQFDNFQEQ